MQYLTLGEAEDEVGVAKSTISRAIKAGRLSAARNEHGHYQIDPAELFRVYPPKPRNEEQSDERNTEQHVAQQHATPENTPTPANETIQWMMKRLDDVESKLELTEQELENKEKAYDELKEAYNMLPSPESFNEKLAAEVERLESEKRAELAEKQKLHDTVMDQERMRTSKRMAETKHESEKWKEELAQRKDEIDQARIESEQLRERTERERQAREALSQKLNALESRGVIARLFNRKPKITQAG
jgi:archaellum component FlaC